MSAWLYESYDSQPVGFSFCKKVFHKLKKNTHELSKTGIETLYTIFQIKQKCKIRDFKEKS